MNILEKEIEDIVFESLRNNKKELLERGFHFDGSLKYDRQVYLGEYGIADIVGYGTTTVSNGSRWIYIHIIEIKKDQVNNGTLLQACRYARAIQRIVNKSLKNAYVSIDISLIGKTINQSDDFVYMADIFGGVKLYTYSIDLVQGIKFNQHRGYFLKEESLPVTGRYFNELKSQLRALIGVEEDLPF